MYYTTNWGLQNAKTLDTYSMLVYTFIFSFLRKQYCFVYVDKRTKSALIEPVSTREKYRRKGIGTAMLHGAVMRCKKHGIERCYVDSFGWRKEFYAAAGFFTESSVSFWYKNLR